MVDAFDLSEFGSTFYWAGDWTSERFPQLQRGLSYVFRHDGAFYLASVAEDGEPFPSEFSEDDFTRIPDANVATVSIRPEWAVRANYTVTYPDSFPDAGGLAPLVTDAHGVRDEYLHVPGGPSGYQRFGSMVQMAFLDFPVPDISDALEKFDPDTGGVVLGTWPNVDGAVPSGQDYVNAALFARDVLAPEGEDPRLWQAYKPSNLGPEVAYAGDEFGRSNTDLDAGPSAYRVDASFTEAFGVISPAPQRSAGRTDYLSAAISANLPGGDEFESHFFDLPGTSFESLVRNSLGVNGDDYGAAVWIRPGSTLWEPPPPTLIDKWASETGGKRFELFDREIVIVGERPRAATPDPEPPPRLGGVSLGRASSGVVRRGG